MIRHRSAMFSRRPAASGLGTELIMRFVLRVAQVLKAAGYRTLMTWKHHGLDNLVTFGFDRYFRLRDGACNYFNPGLQREGEGVPAHKTGANFFPRSWCIDDKLYQPYTPPERDFYPTDYFTNYALARERKGTREEKGTHLIDLKCVNR